MNKARAYYSNPRLKQQLFVEGEISNKLPEFSADSKECFLALTDYEDVEKQLVIAGRPETFTLEHTEPLVFAVDQEFEKAEHQRYLQSIERALLEIESNNLQKIVLARRKKLKILKGNPLSLQSWVSQFFRDDHYGHQFVFAHQNELFISLSPESLFEINQSTLRVDSIAGTTLRGNTEQEDQSYFEQLARDPKEQREHELVKNDIVERLAKLNIKGQWRFENQALKLKYIQHLHSLYEASLPANTELFTTLLKALHPTPAVGGLPKQTAFEQRKLLEGFARAHYAAPFLVKTPEISLAAVGLRCAHVVGDEVTVYAGAGIVEGSTPEKEWKETERKCRQFL
jgi:menaquinone-specific isochorismate synthase